MILFRVAGRAAPLVAGLAACAFAAPASATKLILRGPGLLSPGAPVIARSTQRGRRGRELRARGIAR